MSDQTKTQAIGYMAKALFQGGYAAGSLKTFIEQADQEIPEEALLNNFSTMDFLSQFLNENDLTQEEKAPILSELNWAYNDFTVEEAADFYTGFILVCRLVSLQRKAGML